MKSRRFSTEDKLLSGKLRAKPVFVLALLIFAGSLLISGCGGGGSTKPGVFDTVTGANLPDRTPPADVTGFSSSPGDGTIALQWAEPKDSEFSGVLIRRGVERYPASPLAASTATDTVVFNGTGAGFTDTGLKNAVRYYYTAFTYDTNGNYSSGRNVSTVCEYKPFMIVAIADTQYYSLDYPDLFKTVTQWIADNSAEKNIKFAVQEGDLTHNNSVNEWNNAAAAMSNLDGIVPYAVAVGNHDSPSGNTTRFNAAFPYSKYSAFSYFGGAYETGKMDNTYYYFSAGGTDWLAMSLTYNPGNAVLEWANDVVEANPSRRVLVVTHAYAMPDNDLGSIGQNIWNKFAKKHKNISFILNGHYTDGTAGRVESTGDNGNKVYGIFANYQDEFFGGLGYIRLMEMNPTTGTVDVKTYSASMQLYKTDSGNEFTLQGVDLSPPDD